MWDKITESSKELISFFSDSEFSTAKKEHFNIKKNINHIDAKRQKLINDKQKLEEENINATQEITEISNTISSVEQTNEILRNEILENEDIISKSSNNDTVDKLLYKNTTIEQDIQTNNTYIENLLTKQMNLENVISENNRTIADITSNIKELDLELEILDVDMRDITDSYESIKQTTATAIENGSEILEKVDLVGAEIKPKTIPQINLNSLKEAAKKMEEKNSLTNPTESQTPSIPKEQLDKDIKVSENKQQQSAKDNKFLFNSNILASPEELAKIGTNIQPKLKHAYVGEFKHTYLQGLDWMIKSVDRPKVDIELATQVRNNVERHYPIKVSHGDLTISLWDDIEHRTINTIQKFFENQIWKKTGTHKQFTEILLRDHTLIPKFSIYDLSTDTNKSLKYTYHNCILSSFDFDAQEDENDEGVFVVQLVFKVESFDIKEENPSLVNKDNHPLMFT